MTVATVARPRFLVLAFVAILAVAGAASLALRTPAEGLTAPPPGVVITKVSICHATGSTANNPYVINEPDATGDVSGHAGHTGPVWAPGASPNSWGDIIPPFTYSGGTFAGLNWTAAGQAIYANDCNPVTTPTTSGPPPTTSGPTPTTSGPTPTTSVTTTPGGTTPGGTAPGGTGGGAPAPVSPSATQVAPSAVVAQPATVG